MCRKHTNGWAEYLLAVALLGRVLVGCGAATPAGSDDSVAECVDGEEQCVDGAHEVCQGGLFVASPCEAGQACVDGACTACACEPGSARATCTDGFTRQVCAASCLTYENVACEIDQACVDGACVAQICTPGATHCADESTTEICNDHGTAYVTGTTCGPKEQCYADQGCISRCDLPGSSAEGCSFFVFNMDNFDEGYPDALVVGNPSPTLSAIVSVYSSYAGAEELAAGDVVIAPLATYTYSIPNDATDVIHGVSALRTGGSFRIASDVPLVASLHSPLTPYYTNDSSCLLPERGLGTRYFVGSFYDALGSMGSPYPSYFDVVATVDGTTVTVTVPQATAAGSGVPAMAAGESQSFAMNRYDTLHIINANAGTVDQRDVTGTLITSSAPIAVFGGVECAQVPVGYTYCDHIEEQMMPVETWGTTYVGAHLPKRSDTERYYWRVLAGEDGTTVTTAPALAGFPVVLGAGQFYQFYAQADATAAGGSFVLAGDKPFAAFQYMTGQNAFGAGAGDPAMVTAVPVHQFLRRYFVVSPGDYEHGYVQIIRTTAEDVTVDGTVVPASAYYVIGDYSVADYEVAAGVHLLESAAPFGAIMSGYTYATSYAQPAGMALVPVQP